jgi:hypothetical protein
LIFNIFSGSHVPKGAILRIGNLFVVVGVDEDDIIYTLYLFGKREILIYSLRDADASFLYKDAMAGVSIQKILRKALGNILFRMSGN